MGDQLSLSRNCYNEESMVSRHYSAEMLHLVEKVRERINHGQVSLQRTALCGHLTTDNDISGVISVQQLIFFSGFYWRSV